MDKKSIEQDIIVALGLTNLPEAEKARLLEKMLGVVQDRINDRILAALDKNAEK